ncbi:hypothetical protein JIN84_18005 [Luteolibacter yonseiensis]|uniref:Recombinase RecT n=1 Tax=Luteolibacter yonseiensis TaxID=1144680 RepID=A0A934VCV1_9BACT|nr:hypothetical protein [Luteolibacter yonseiensis]MBK1817520.1 hypothetical protein [Luteolibacter yonseiensis]
MNSLLNPANAEPQQYQDPIIVANLMNEQRFSRMMIIAQTMASASLIPEHLLGRKKGQNMDWFTPDEVRANCFLIVNQSFRWGMDPFAVMPETYVVGGKLGYQGKLIAGLVNSMADLEERLSYEFKGTKGQDDFTVIVSGKFRGAKAPVTVEVSVGQAKTDNLMWRKDPEQKLCYTGATKWARRWCPEILLGILIDDDLDHSEMRDATPRADATPPKVITGGRSAKQKEAPPAVEAEAVAADGQQYPPREVMTKAIKVAMKTAKLGQPAAETRCREHGLLKHGQTFQGTNDTELFAIYSKIETLFPAPVDPPIINVFYENHAVHNSPAEATKPWTLYKLRYTLAGEEEPREATTFSSTFGEFLDKLEGGESLLLSVEPGEKGDNIKTMELAPNAGGEA